MAVRIDYHCHPNLPFAIPLVGEFLARRKAKRMWAAFARHKLDAVIVSEHAFKEPKATFEFMERCRPADARTMLIPGVEILTSEGADLIVFGDDPKAVYRDEEITTPLKLNVEQVLKRIEGRADLRGIVVHPYSPASTSCVQVFGEQRTEDIVKRLGFVEMHNGCFHVLKRLLDATGLCRILSRLHQHICTTEQAPAQLLRQNIIATGGSDAHHSGSVGDCMIVPARRKPASRRTMFTLMTTTSGMWSPRLDKPMHSLLADFFTVLNEAALMACLYLQQVLWWTDVTLRDNRERVPLSGLAPMIPYRTHQSAFGKSDSVFGSHSIQALRMHAPGLLRHRVKARGQRVHAKMQRLLDRRGHAH